MSSLIPNKKPMSLKIFTISICNAILWETIKFDTRLAVPIFRPFSAWFVVFKILIWIVLEKPFVLRHFAKSQQKGNLKRKLKLCFKHFCEHITPEGFYSEVYIIMLKIRRSVYSPLWSKIVLRGKYFSLNFANLRV